MDKTKTSLSRTVLAGALAAMVVSVAAGAYVTEAHETDGEGNNHGERSAMHEAARAAVEAGDYGAWAVALADAPKADERVNEGTFDVIVEANRLRAAGETEAARDLLRENDVRPPRRGESGERPERRENMQAARAAVEAGDYAAWVVALADTPKAAEFVNEQNFNVLVEAQGLRAAGDKEAARALLDENDIHPPKHRMKHRAERAGAAL